MRNVAVRDAETRVLSPVKVIGYSADVAVGTVDDFILLLWRRRVVPQGVGWAREAFAKLAGERKHDRKLVFLTTVVPGCDISTPAEVRKDIAALLKTYESRIACAAIVFENNGFGMTIVRSVITAIQMASRSRFPNAVFGSVESALGWMATQDDAQVGVESSRIVEAIGRLRAL
jgi:hypothetical protein